jgi:phosphopantothenoylcysteine decarboxylase / phosphopantothenate---cysteine ligase
MTDPRRRIVLGVTGGIAAYKAALLLRLFTEAGHDVRVVPTAAALKFVGEPTWAALSGHPVATDVWSDVHEVPHVRLGQTADLVVVAPATTDLLARAAHGLADDLLTNVLLTARCPILLAPAMHTEMWQHPATQANVALLRSRGTHVLEPASGRLTGSDTGPGRLPEPETVFAAAVSLLSPEPPVAPAPRSSSAPRPAAVPALQPTSAGREDAGGTSGSGLPSSVLAGKRIVVSAGGTREPLDPVRYIGNRSSGRQGVALAAAGLALGAKVTLVAGPLEVPVPAGIDVVAVGSALEMRDAVHGSASSADVVVMAAAVADFRPGTVAEHKIKKSERDDDAPVIHLVRNPDILRELVAARRPGQLVVGFAAETGDETGSVLDHARAKLARKGCDLLVVNDVSAGKVFGRTDTEVTILRPDGTATPVPAGTKEAVAQAIWVAVGDLLDRS